MRPSFYGLMSSLSREMLAGTAFTSDRLVQVRSDHVRCNRRNLCLQLKKVRCSSGHLFHF